ncbi:uncharacterized protein [Parasteatoda tepidariorum]|uniref:uncharacterized protein n=1 Tax=Parasteatoda tepidariorum TaxID=114398 RepID=UPI00077FD9AF|nr:uncharacterized protein LOC107441222 [Parasteatoda tepidariorum]
MKDKKVMKTSVAALVLFMALNSVQSQGLMGGGYKHRGNHAIELLLATGILAKLFNHRGKLGHAGRQFMSALIGGPRYHHPRFANARFPLDMAIGHPALLQDDILDASALSSMNVPLMDNDLLLNQESSLLAARAPLLMSPSTQFFNDGHLFAEAQLNQQLLAARRARKILEAKKLLAASEAKNILAAQSEAMQMLAAEDAAQATAFLAADQSRQYSSAMPPPKHFVPRQVNQGNMFQGHSAQQQQGMSYMGGQQPSQQMQGSMNSFLGSQPLQMQGSMNSFAGSQPQQMQGSMNSFAGSQPQQMQGSASSFIPSQPQPMQESLNSFMGSQSSQQMQQGSLSSYLASQSPNQMQAAASNYFRSHAVPPPMQSSSARADHVLHLPPGMSDAEANRVIANLHRFI